MGNIDEIVGTCDRCGEAYTQEEASSHNSLCQECYIKTLATPKEICEYRDYHDWDENVESQGNEDCEEMTLFCQCKTCGATWEAQGYWEEA